MIDLERARAAYDAAQAAYDDARRHGCDVSTRLDLERRMRVARRDYDVARQDARPWTSQVGHSMITHATRAAAEAHVRRSREGLVVQYDEAMMPVVTIVIQNGKIVKEATR